MPAYQDNATHLCVVAVYQKKVLKVFMLDTPQEIAIQARYRTALENAQSCTLPT